MGVYRVKLAGRTSTVLLRAKSKTEAIERVVLEVGALTGDEVEEALDAGDKVWKLDEPFPADEGVLTIVGDKLLIDGEPVPGVKSIVFEAEA